MLKKKNSLARLPAGAITGHSPFWLLTSTQQPKRRNCLVYIYVAILRELFHCVCFVLLLFLSFFLFFVCCVCSCWLKFVVMNPARKTSSSSSSWSYSEKKMAIRPFPPIFIHKQVENFFCTERSAGMNNSRQVAKTEVLYHRASLNKSVHQEG